MIAAGNNENAAVVAMVASLGTDLDARDKDGYTALMYAASKAHNPEVVIALLKAEASVKAKNNKGYSVHDYAKTDAMQQLQKASQ